MTADSSESSYFLARAKQEQSCAENSENPKVAAIHREMAVRYSAKALLLHVEEASSGEVIRFERRRTPLQRPVGTRRRAVAAGRSGG